MFAAQKTGFEFTQTHLCQKKLAFILHNALRRLLAKQAAAPHDAKATACFRW